MFPRVDIQRGTNIIAWGTKERLIRKMRAGTQAESRESRG